MKGFLTATQFEVNKTNYTRPSIVCQVFIFVSEKYPRQLRAPAPPNHRPTHQLAPLDALHLQDTAKIIPLSRYFRAGSL